MRRAFLAALFVLTGAASAWADAAPLYYSRSDIAILRAHPPLKPPMPWQTQGTPEEARIPLDVEIRDAATLYNQEGWFSASAPAEGSGVLLMFAAPKAAPVTQATDYAPLDILMIDREGKILRIAPNIVLAELDQDIVPPSPILAFLLLKGGTCQALGIAPGDRVEYDLFKKAPVVLGLPGK